MRGFFAGLLDTIGIALQLVATVADWAGKRLMSAAETFYDMARVVEKKP